MDLEHGSYVGPPAFVYAAQVVYSCNQVCFVVLNSLKFKSTMSQHIVVYVILSFVVLPLKLNSFKFKSTWVNILLCMLY